jgi:hypothetical protein
MTEQNPVIIMHKNAVYPKVYAELKVEGRILECHLT